MICDSPQKKEAGLKVILTLQSAPFQDLGSDINLLPS